MENFQSKIQKGLNTVQKGIEGGKNKFQTSQEIIALKDMVEENEEKRTNLILSLGELTYGKIRNNKINDDEVNSLAEDILELDKEIFNLLKIIDEKNIEEHSLICECGNLLTPSDRFCKNCGKKVEQISAKDDEEKTICHRCESEILASSKYCNCCGIKIN